MSYIKKLVFLVINMHSPKNLLILRVNIQIMLVFSRFLYDTLYLYKYVIIIHT
jgi:hypothetical protein